jgi:ABC-type bacteriocin/lantibiotic exporter with double-glycine peptidase domain
MQFELFPREKDLRTDYDRTIGLAKEVEAAENNEVFVEEWPSNNTIEMENLCYKYKSNLPNVLNSISFQIKHN